MTVISALAILIVVILIGILYVYKIERRLCEIQLQLDKQKAELDHIIPQLRALQSDSRAIDRKLQVIIQIISNLKEELHDTTRSKEPS